jgi:hypothetical protein
MINIFIPYMGLGIIVVLICFAIRGLFDMVGALEWIGTFLYATMLAVFSTIIVMVTFGGIGFVVGFILHLFGFDALWFL